MENYPFEWKLEAERLEMKVILSILTIISLCAGLPALFWSVRDLIHHRKNGHRVSVFTILLLLTNYVVLILSPYILLKFSIDEISFCTNWTCLVLWALWSSSRDCGIFLHKLVVLEGIISGKYPLYTASVFSSPCFIIFYKLVFLCIFSSYIYFCIICIISLFVLLSSLFQ